MPIERKVLFATASVLLLRPHCFAAPRHDAPGCLIFGYREVLHSIGDHVSSVRRSPQPGFRAHRPGSSVAKPGRTHSSHFGIKNKQHTRYRNQQA